MENSFSAKGISQYREFPILLSPVLLFFLYLALYALFENKLGISHTFATADTLFEEKHFEPVKETIYRSAWGISLIISSVVNFYLLFFCIFNIFMFKSTGLSRNIVFYSVLFSSFALFIYIYFYADLGGGIAQKLYEHINSIDKFSELVSFEKAIDLTAGLGFVGVYLVSILLTYICFRVRNLQYLGILELLKTFKALFYITVTFLSTTIAQLFFQYQWFSVFISPNKNVVVDIVFVYPLIMSVFYVGIVVALFIPTSEVLKHLVIRKASIKDPDVSEDELGLLFPKMSGARGILENIKSLLLFTSPILTVIVADLVKMAIS